MASILRARGLGRLANRSHTHTLPIHRNNHRQNTLPSESCQTRFLFLCTAEKKKKKQLRLFDTLPLGQT